MDVCQDLLRLCVRAFYTPAHTILVELLIANHTMSLNQIAASLQTPLKETQKICGVLKVAGVISVITKWTDFKSYASANGIVRSDETKRKTSVSWVTN